MKVSVFIRQKNGSIIGKDPTCVFYIIVSLIALVSLQTFYENIIYVIKTYPSQNINFHRMTIYLEILIDPWSCLHMLSRSSPLPQRITYQMLETSCSLFNVYLVCLSLPLCIQIILLLMPDMLSKELK